MLVMGLDPGLAITGYGLVRESLGWGVSAPNQAVSMARSPGELSLVEYGTVTTPAGQPLAERLLSIDEELRALIDKHRPDVVAVEEMFFGKNVTTAMIVGQARGVAILAAARAGLPVREYKPMAVKQAITGYGKASKSQMQEMVRLLLNLEDVPKPDDAADAVAVAICHVYAARLDELMDSADPW
jgi:crossover junction endodeoxyribonuclease RuvC